MFVQVIGNTDNSACKSFWSRRGLRESPQVSYDRSPGGNVQDTFKISNVPVQWRSGCVQETAAPSLQA